MNRLKKKMLLIISDEYGRNLTGVQKNLHNKILVLCVASVCLRAHVMRVMLRGVIFHLYTIRGPFPYMEWPPQDCKFMSTTAMCCQHYLIIKRNVASWLVSESYTCAFIDYLTCFLKGGYFLRAKGEIRSAEIIKCGGRKNGVF